MSSNRLFGKLALGAALGVALTLTATQAWNVTAAPGDTDTTYVPVSPCRLFDTRPGAPPADGTKAPIAAGVANVRIQQVTGNVGRCVGIPADASAVQLNVTALNPTAQSFLTIYPADKPLPDASNLNWVAGQAPTPNSVTVTLSPDGKIKFFNAFGTVDVIADVAGYYIPSSLTELENRLGSVESQLTVLGTNQPVVGYSSGINEVPLSLSPVNGGIVEDRDRAADDHHRRSQRRQGGRRRSRHGEAGRSEWPPGLSDHRRPRLHEHQCGQRNRYWRTSRNRLTGHVAGAADPRHQPCLRRRRRREHVRPDVRCDRSRRLQRRGHHPLPVDVGHVHRRLIRTTTETADRGVGHLSPHPGRCLGPRRAIPQMSGGVAPNGSVRQDGKTARR